MRTRQSSYDPSGACRTTIATGASLTIFSSLLCLLPGQLGSAQVTSTAERGSTAIAAGGDIGDITVNDVEAIQRALKPEVRALLDALAPKIRMQRKVLRRLLAQSEALMAGVLSDSAAEELSKELEYAGRLLEFLKESSADRDLQSRGVALLRDGKIPEAEVVFADIVTASIEDSYERGDFARALHELFDAQASAGNVSRDGCWGIDCWSWNGPPRLVALRRELICWHAKIDEALGDPASAAPLWHSLKDVSPQMSACAQGNDLQTAARAALQDRVPRLASLRIGGLPSWVEVDVTGREHWVVDREKEGDELLLNAGEYLVQMRDDRYENDRRQVVRVVRLHEGETLEVDEDILGGHRGLMLYSSFGIAPGIIVREKPWISGGAYFGLYGGYFVAEAVAIVVDALGYYGGGSRVGVLSVGPGLGVEVQLTRDASLGARIGPGFRARSNVAPGAIADLRSQLRVCLWDRFELSLLHGYVNESASDFAISVALRWDPYRF